MKLLKNNKIENAYIHIAYDEDTASIHLLDLNKKGTMTLTNSINIAFQYKVLTLLSLELPPSAYTWLLYGTDGIVSTWDMSNGFKHMTVESKILYKPFLDAMKEVMDPRM